jgi:hypothetical protein
MKDEKMVMTEMKGRRKDQKFVGMEQSRDSTNPRTKVGTDVPWVPVKVLIIQPKGVTIFYYLDHLSRSRDLMIKMLIHTHLHALDLTQTCSNCRHFSLCLLYNYSLFFQDQVYNSTEATIQIFF